MKLELQVVMVLSILLQRKEAKKFIGGKKLTVSWRRPLTYRNQSIDLLFKSMDWFLYERDPHHERVN